MELIKKLKEKYNQPRKDSDFLYYDNGMFGERDVPEDERYRTYQAFRKHPEVFDTFLKATSKRSDVFTDPADRMHEAIVAADLLPDDEDAILIRKALKNPRYDFDGAIMADATKNKDKIVADVNKRAAFDKKVDNAKNVIKSLPGKTAEVAKGVGNAVKDASGKVVKSLKEGEAARKELAGRDGMFDYLYNYGLFGRDENEGRKIYESFKKHPELLIKYASAVKQDKDGTLRPDWKIMHDAIVDADLLEDDEDATVIRNALRDSIYNSEPDVYGLFRKK